MSLKKNWARRLRPLRQLLSGQNPDAFRLSRSQPPLPTGQRYFYLSPDLAMVRLNTGPFLYIDPLDEQICAAIIAEGCWERWISATVMSLLSPGDRVVEVGANVGYYTLTMAARVGRLGHVTSLEANPRLVGLIQRSVRLNSFADRIRLVPKAAMDQPGVVNFVSFRRNSGGGHVSIWAEDQLEDAERFEVEAVRLDDLDCGRVDMIRLDAEGSEPFILRGAAGLLQANPDVVICMEWSVVQMGSRTSVGDFVDWLVGLGFNFWRIGLDSGLKPISAAELLTVEACDIVASRRPPRRR